MKFEVGNEYLTRGGHRARVLKIEKDGANFPVVGEVLIEGSWTLTLWREDGTHAANLGLDLVATNPIHTSLEEIGETTAENANRRVNKLLTLLHKHGICEKCGEMYIHVLDAPYAVCGCGTSEWYELTPYMRLQAQLLKLCNQIEEEGK